MRAEEALQRISSIERAIAQVSSVDKANDYLAQLKAIKEWAKKKRVDRTLIQAIGEAEAKLKRKMGELLKGAVKPGKPKANSDTLSQLGVHRKESERAQAIASIPREMFEAELAKTRDKGEVISQNRLLKLAKERKKKVELDKLRRRPLPPPTGLFHVIVCDPPWSYWKRSGDLTHRSRTPYPSMTVEEISALEVPAKSDCILWLWTTNAFMRQAFDVLDAWAFQEKTILTWVKDRMGTGDWLRGKTEHCLMAVKGKPLVELTNQTTALEAPVGKHSEKPQAFYDLVELLCPYTSRLEMFARSKRKGWVSWGSEV